MRVGAAFHAVVAARTPVEIDDEYGVALHQAAVERGGGYQLVKFEDEFLFNYTRADITAAE
jgi:hypothetical protein